MEVESNWLASWNKLRNEFETEALARPPINLCIESPPSSFEDFGKAMQLCEPWVNPFTGTKTDYPHMIANGIGDIFTYGTIDTPGSFTCFLVHPRVAEAAQRGETMDAVQLLREQAAATEIRFRVTLQPSEVDFGAGRGGNCPVVI